MDAAVINSRHPVLRAAMVLSAFIAAAAIGIGVSACSAGGAPNAPSSSVALPTGTQGAANFDKGYLAVGTGAKAVDLYFDPLCPYCNEFEKANGATLASAVKDGSITFRLHPLTFLDPSSNGTAYSSRASAALTCVAVSDPAATLGYLADLYANQPAEGSDGLTNSKLAALASKRGVADISGCIANGANQAWAQNVTQRALAGPIEGADIPAIKGTPTVLVNGVSFTGSITDSVVFSKFLTSH